MGRTNYSINEMLNSVTKRAFNRYTPQTVDYQHLEAATTTTGLVSNRREYSSASILANVFSLNAKNIVESNYEPFLKTFVRNLISRKTFPIIGSYTFACTDDRRFLAVTSQFSNTEPNEVRVYEFDENLVKQPEFNSSGVIDISGNVETFGVDINSDGSETFVAKKVGTTQVVVDKFDQDLNSVSSTTLMTTSLSLLSASISVSENGVRVAVTATTDHPFSEPWAPLRHLFLQVHDNLNTNEYYSLYSEYQVSNTPSVLMSRNGRVVVVNIGGTVITFEIPVASPSGVVSLSPVHTQTMGIDKFDLSYDGKVMLTHSSSDALIYIWNGLEWKQFGQNIPTGLTQVYSSAISYYADYFVVVSSTAMKIFKLDKTSKIFEQYGNTITGDFGTTGQTVRINNLGDTVVTGNSQINSSSGQSFTYMYDGERWGIIEEVSGSTAGDNLGKFLKLSNNGDKLFLGSTDEILVKSTTITNKSSGWKQRGSVITTTKVNDDFGSSLSLSNDGTYLVIGIPGERGTSLDDTMGGSVKVYRFAQGDWSQYGSEILGDGPVDFGKYVSISLDGSKVAVGSDKNAVVKVYDTTNTTNVYNSTITDTVSVTPLTSLLEMSGDGNRLFINTDPVVSSTILQSLTVVSTPSGNKYSLDGVTQPTLYLKKGVTFTGIQDSLRQDGTHPLKISATPDGTHGGDTTVVAEVDLIGSLTIPNSAPDTLYYFCGQHPNMGGVVKIIKGLSVWDKNDAGVWGYRDGLTEGSAVDLSNNGSYLGVEYNNTGRLYRIDSDGLVSKIGEDITLTTVSSTVNVFRTFTPTHINTNATDSGSLILASYRDATRDVEICSLTWDPTLTGNVSISTQSSELTGFSSLSQAKYGIVLSRNGQTLIVYDDLKFSVYTYDGTQWTFIRSSVIGVAGTSYTIRYVAISYDGTLMAYHFFNAVDGYLISFRNTISGTSLGGISFSVQVSTFAFKSNTTLAVCIPNQDIQLYNYVNNSWILSNEITPGYSSPFTEAHAKWSGYGSRLAVGDANAERVSFYEYDNSLISVTTFSQSGSTISGPTEQVVSGNGNVRVVGHPQYTGYVEIYEKDGNGDWPSTANATFNGSSPTENFGSSIGISETGTRVVIGSGSKMIVVEKSGGTWSQLGSDISGSTTKVAISGDGTKVFNSHGTNLYSYELSSGNWVTYLSTITTDGSIVKVNSSSNGDDIALSKSNSNKVYRKSSITTRLGADINGEAASDESGWSVSLSADGSRVAIGAYRNDGNGTDSGHVRVYDWSGSSWTKVGADIDGEAAQDYSGWSVSLSADGSRVAIGAYANDGNGSNSGHVRVYDWSGSSWTKVGVDIDGEAASDYSGYSVSLSADGSRVAIGARYNDGNGNNSGHVRVYKNPGSYELQSTDSGPMIDISNDGNTTLTVNSGMGYFNIAALSGDATKAVIWNGILKQYHYTSGSWVETYELNIDYTPTSLSINTDGSIVGVASSSDVRFYVFGPVQTPIGWTLHSFIAGGGNTLENFGSIVDISNDGNTVVVGAPGDGTSSYKGYIKVYDYVSSAWTLRHTITSLGTSDRNLGKSVSLSSDGNRVGYVFDQTQVTTPATSGSIVINSNYSSGISTNNGGSWTNNNGFYLGSSLIRLTGAEFGGTNSGLWFPVTFGSQWSITFEWSLDNNETYGDADDMRVVFYAPNQPSSYAGSQHGGYNVFHGFYGSEYQRVRTPTDSDLVSRSVAYGSSTSYKTVTVSYNNGVLFTGVTGTNTTALNNGYSYTFTGSHLAAQQALWGTQTYVAITGRTGGVAANQFIRNINISWNTTETTTTSSQASIRDNVNGTLINPIGSDSDLVNVSEERELSAMSMSYDGTQYGIRAVSGSYDAVVKIRQPILNGWTLSGSIIQFTAPNSIASNSLRALVSSSDGNVIAFGMNTIIKVYGFSNGVWSQLGSDIVPSVSNPNEISIDLSSDGTTLAVLVDRTTSDPAVCKVFTYSSGSWSQSGSTIDFRPTGINKVRISGNGTTLALGNNTPDSPYPLNVVRVYRKFQDWESIFGTITEGKTPTNFFGASLNLTNDGNNLVTYNTSGVGFYTSSTKAVPSQHLNDITVSGATIVMGDVHLTDSGDRLFVMSGDERVRVYDTTHNQESEFGASINVRDFSVTKDGSSMIVTSDIGLAQVFSRNDTSWSQIGSNITANMSGGGVTTDIKSGGNSIVLLGSSDDLQLHKYENGSWSQIGTSSGTRGTSVVITDTDDIVVGSGSTKTFEIKDEFQDISFTAPTLSLNGDKYVRLESGASYTEVGATVTTSAANTPGVKISGGVTSDEPRVYTIKYEAEDFQRKQAEPIFRTVEVIPKVSIIKLEGPRVIYHTYDTKLDDPGVTASVPINIYWRKHNSTTVYTGFPNSLLFEGQITIYYTNDTPDEYLRIASSVERTVYVRRRPVLTLQGSSTVYNPLGQRYVDLGVNITQSGLISPDVTVSFNEPNVNLSQTQTVTYTAKDQFGIEAIPITRQVIVKKRPTITTSGTLYRIRYDPISIPTPLVEPASLSGSLQSYNNIFNNQIGNYSITYNVTDGDGISAITTRQSYQVGSYGKLELSKNGVLSAFSREGQSLAVFSTDVQLYRLGPDRSWSSNGSIATPVGSSVSSMRFSNDGRYIVIGMSLHLTIGLVRVYKENPLFENNWEQIGIDLFGVDYLGKFGHKVEINDSGSRIFVGAPEANRNGGTLFKAGFVKVYEWNGVFWDEKNIIEGQNPSELLGTSISISKDGNLLAIGSPGFTRTTIVNSVVTSVNVGKTSVYRYVNGTWEDYLGSVIDNGTEGARNAFSLSLSSDGRTLAVGSESNGGVRVYAISALKWRPIGSHISGNFGKTVSISDDATVVIGSENEYYGRAYIYTLTNDWTKSGITFDKVIASGVGTNDFGKRVNVDSSGNFVCVDSATDVRIYEI